MKLCQFMEPGNGLEKRVLPQAKATAYKVLTRSKVYHNFATLVTTRIWHQLNSFVSQVFRMLGMAESPTGSGQNNGTTSAESEPNLPSTSRMPPTMSPESSGALGTRKICGVCGDRAKSYHFGGISCDSCKAFFRRSVQNDAYHNFQCPYEGRCDITITSRKCCQYCRFRKCVNIGMEKSWVMTEEERVQLLRTRMERKAKSKQETADPTLRDAGSLYLGISSGPSTSGLSGSGDESTQSQGARTPTSAARLGSLSEYDAAVINDMVNKYQLSFQAVPYPAEIIDHDGNRPSIEVVSIFTATIKRLTHYVGQLDTFTELPTADQATLLRAGMLEMLLIRAAYSYDLERECWPNVRLPQFEGCPRLRVADIQRLVSPSLHDMHMRFMIGFRELALDEPTSLLLLLVALFTPERRGLQRPDIVAQFQEDYSILLRTHMDSRHGLEASARLYPKLLLKLPDLRQLNDAHTDFHLHLSYTEIQQIQRQFGDILTGYRIEETPPSLRYHHATVSSPEHQDPQPSTSHKEVSPIPAPHISSRQESKERRIEESLVSQSPSSPEEAIAHSTIRTSPVRLHLLDPRHDAIQQESDSHESSSD